MPPVWTLDVGPRAARRRNDVVVAPVEEDATDANVGDVSAKYGPPLGTSRLLNVPNLPNLLNLPNLFPTR